MTRIGEKFAQTRKEKRIAFMPFLVAGDPDFKTSISIARAIASRADLLEIGFPYSDPLADGPTIQAADSRALAAGMDTDRAFELITQIRKFSSIPISVLVYANLIHQRGLNRFYRDARSAGIDGVLIPDVPVEEAGPFAASARRVHIDTLFLVAHTTTPSRLTEILKYAQGYLYAVSVLGVTGIRNSLPPEVAGLIRRIKRQTDMPVAVGFGISRRGHIAELKAAGADGAIVGSALVKIIENNVSRKPQLHRRVSHFIQGLTGI